MKVKNLNSSSRKTNMKIKESFAELLHEKGSLNNLTVTDLVKKAGITRASFYTHYESIYDVAQDIQDETLDVLMSNVSGVKTLEDIDIYIDKIVDYLKANDKIYHMILTSNDPLLFASKLNKQMNKIITEFVKDKDVKEQEQLMLNISFFCDGCINLIIKHFRNETNLSLDEIKTYIKHMAKVIIKVI